MSSHSDNTFLQGTLILKGGRIAGLNLRILGGLSDAALVELERIHVTDPDQEAIKLGYRVASGQADQVPADLATPSGSARPHLGSSRK